MMKVFHSPETTSDCKFSKWDQQSTRVTRVVELPKTGEYHNSTLQYLEKAKAERTEIESSHAHYAGKISPSNHLVAIKEEQSSN